LAAWLYPELRRAPGGHVLADPGWLLENRMSYRLLGSRADHGLELAFGTTTFFEVFDVKQA
jgi:hypothetical protein